MSSAEVLPTPASPRQTILVFTEPRGLEPPPSFDLGLPGGELPDGEGGSERSLTSRGFDEPVRRRNMDIGRCNQERDRQRLSMMITFVRC